MRLSRSLADAGVLEQIESERLKEAAVMLATFGDSLDRPTTPRGKLAWEFLSQADKVCINEGLI